MAFYVGVDIGGTKVRVVIADARQILLKIVQFTIKQGPSDTLVNQVIKMIKQGIRELDLLKTDLKGIGISSAGPFVNGTSIFSPNICGPELGNDWTAIPMVSTLRDTFGSQIPIELANDCVSSVQAEHLFGAGKGYDNCVYITISTGVGAGVIVDNHLMQGKGHNAGHFGHIILKKDGPLCGCGQRGCAESILSGRSIAKRAKEAGMKYNGTSDFSAKEVFDLYREGDKIAKQIISETIEYLGVFFSSVINVTDTEVIILGGSVIFFNEDILIPAVKKYLETHSYHPISDGVEIKISVLRENVGDLAGLSLILPESIITKWQVSEPWKKEIKKIINE
ncbi:MAG: ROK family protein [Promethearchaeota archaeon]